MKDSGEKKTKKVTSEKTTSKNKKTKTETTKTSKKDATVKKVSKQNIEKKKPVEKKTTKKSTSKESIKKEKPVTKTLSKEKKTVKIEQPKIVSNVVLPEPVLVKEMKPVTLENKTKEVDNNSKSQKQSESLTKQSSIAVEPKNTNRFGLVEVIILVVITCIVSIVMGVLIASSLLHSENYSTNDYSSKMKEFIDNYDYIKEVYGDSVSEDTLLNGALNGMLEAVGDPYASFIEQEDRLNQELAGSLYGVGLEIINNADGNIEVYNVFENSPAGKANLQKGDIILSVNSLDLRNKSTSVFSTYVQGSNSDEYIVKYLRNGIEEEVTMKKEYVIIPSVFPKTFERDGKKIGYLQVTIFSATTYKQFKTELEKLEKENIDSLIIDVRSNSGGSLDAVVDMLSLFLDSSHIIYQTDTQGKIEKFHSKGKETKQYPISILINGSSASASEILASALKEEYGATLVGTKTFGKGTVQQVKTLQNGNKYKLTTKKWLTPSGKWVGDNALEPDCMIPLSNEYSENPSDETDNQLQKALEILTK